MSLLVITNINFNSDNKMHYSLTGGASITIGANGIEFKCPGTLTVKTGTKKHISGAKVAGTPLNLPVKDVTPKKFKFS